MKREDLRKLGLTDEQVDQVMSMNGEDVNASKAIVAQRDENHQDTHHRARRPERAGRPRGIKDNADIKKNGWPTILP